jgi:hypothetical protein
MLRVAGGADATLADVRRSAQEFADFETNLTPYKRVLDLWVSQYFGNSHALEFIDLYRDEVIPTLRDGREVSSVHAAAIEQAKELWQEKRFFHWDLEFPEVFVDLQRRDWKENPGFDAVIGNPPYIQLSMESDLDQYIKKYLPAKFGSSMGRLNTFGFFIVLGIEILKDSQVAKIGGLEGMIVPNTILTIPYYTELRHMLLNSCRVERILTFDKLPFKDAVVENVVLILRKATVNSLREPNQVYIDVPLSGNLAACRRKGGFGKVFVEPCRFCVHLDVQGGII